MLIIEIMKYNGRISSNEIIQLENNDNNVSCRKIYRGFFANIQAKQHLLYIDIDADGYTLTMCRNAEDI